MLLPWSDMSRAASQLPRALTHAISTGLGPCSLIFPKSDSERSHRRLLSHDARTAQQETMSGRRLSTSMAARSPRASGQRPAFSQVLSAALQAMEPASRLAEPASLSKHRTPSHAWLVSHALTALPQVTTLGKTAARCISSCRAIARVHCWPFSCTLSTLL